MLEKHCGIIGYGYIEVFIPFVQRLRCNALDVPRTLERRIRRHFSVPGGDDGGPHSRKFCLDLK